MPLAGAFNLLHDAAPLAFASTTYLSVSTEWGLANASVTEAGAMPRGALLPLTNSCLACTKSGFLRPETGAHMSVGAAGHAVNPVTSWPPEMLEGLELEVDPRLRCRPFAGN